MNRRDSTENRVYAVLDPGMKIEFDIRCRMHGTNMTTVVREGIAEWMTAHPRKEEHKIGELVS